MLCLYLRFKMVTIRMKFFLPWPRLEYCGFWGLNFCKNQFLNDKMEKITKPKLGFTLLTILIMTNNFHSILVSKLVWLQLSRMNLSFCSPSMSEYGCLRQASCSTSVNVQKVITVTGLRFDYRFFIWSHRHEFGHVVNIRLAFYTISSIFVKVDVRNVLVYFVDG